MEPAVTEYRAGIVGVGSRTVHGDQWARTLAGIPNVRLLRLADEEPDALERTAKAVGVEHTSPDPRSVLEADDLDIVVVNTVDHLHAEQVNAALDAGKHVLTDKPLGVSTAEAAGIASKAKSEGLKVAVGQVYRFAPHYEFLKERVERGELGRIFQVEAGYVHDLRPIWKATPWRTDPSNPQNPWFGGALHPIDMVHWIGGEIEQVCALENKASKVEEFPINDNALILLKFASGAIGRVWSTFGIRQNPGFQTFRNTFGDLGSCWANAIRNEVELHVSWGVDGVGGPMLVPFSGGANPNLACVLDFLAAIESDGTPRSDANQAVRNMVVLEAAIASVESGRFEPVTPPG